MKWQVTITLNFKTKPKKRDILFRLFDMLKTNKVEYVLVRNTNTEDKKLSIDEIEELVREEYVYIGQSNKFTLDHMTTETTYIGQDPYLAEECIDVVKGHGDIEHED